MTVTMQRYSLCTIVTLLLLHQGDAANILALVVTPSPSHHIWNRALMLELAARGHNVTVVSPDPEKQKIPNHTDIFLEGMYNEIQINFDYVAMSKESTLHNYISIFEWGTTGCKKGLQSKGAKQLLDMVGKQSFDLIIVEVGIDECFLGFVPLFGSPPLMAIIAYSSPPWAGDISGSPNTPSYISVCNLPYTDHMTFLQRMTNFLLYSFVTVYRSWIHLPNQHKIAQDFFGKHIPSIADIEKNISIILANIHYSFDYPRPLTPALIPVAGMHIKPSQRLPQDLQQYLDDAPHGVILFSLGSNVRSDKLHVQQRNAFLQAFAQLKENILWKWESDQLPNQPPNVRISKWLPQNDILGHPNIKLFITHGGLLSTQEALYHGIPMIGVPFLADQYININKNIERGVAEKLDISTITPTIVLETVKKVLQNPRYKERIRILSAQFRDRPDSALNTAVWWTEYVIRHKGANHIRSAALDLHWYQYFLLDIICTLTLSFLVVSVLFCKIFRCIKSNCLKISQDKTKKKRN